MTQENGLQVQVRNIRLGVATYWSLEKFEDKLVAMKEAYEVCLKKKKPDMLLIAFMNERNFQSLPMRVPSHCLPLQKCKKNKSMLSHPEEIF